MLKLWKKNLRKTQKSKNRRKKKENRNIKELEEEKKVKHKETLLKNKCMNLINFNNQIVDLFGLTKDNNN